MLLALKAFGVKIKNANNKIVPHILNGYTTDKINPAIILAKVINDNGKFYLVAFIRHSRYGLETKYTKDFCKVYRIN